jgi:hypothetical protein
MEGMTMEFPVKDQREFAMLHPGLPITAKVYSRPSDYEYWIADIKPAAAEPLTTPSAKGEK